MVDDTSQPSAAEPASSTAASAASAASASGAIADAGKAGSAIADPALQRLIEQVRAARADKQCLDIHGGSTKAFYGGPRQGQPLDVRPLAGISSYEPTELVVTVRGGTPLVELEAALAEAGQCLPFEPPRFSAEASNETVGGMIAAGLAGPARSSMGGVRDHVLGAKLLTGRAELLSFGGTVMKNVAGYDVSRALAGSLGVLGVICEVSLKVLPVASTTVTLRQPASQAEAIQRLNKWGGQPLPLHASAWWEGMLVLRLSGANAAVDSARRQLGGEVIEPELAARFWQGLRDQQDEFFRSAARALETGASLWRLSVPATTPPIPLSGEQLLEWGGAQRWICTSAPAATLREAAAAVGGHAVLFRGKDKSTGAFAPLSPALARIQGQLMLAFDPDALFNPGRLWPQV